MSVHAMDYLVHVSNILLLVSYSVRDILWLAMALTGDPSHVSASFTEPGRYISWPLANLRALMDKRPDLRVTLQRLVNQDLARKLQSLV